MKMRWCRRKHERADLVAVALVEARRLEIDRYRTAASIHAAELVLSEPKSDCRVRHAAGVGKKKRSMNKRRVRSAGEARLGLWSEDRDDHGNGRLSLIPLCCSLKARQPEPTACSSSRWARGELTMGSRLSRPAWRVYPDGPFATRPVLALGSGVGPEPNAGDRTWRRSWLWMMTPGPRYCRKMLEGYKF